MIRVMNLDKLSHGLSQRMQFKGMQTSHNHSVFRNSVSPAPFFPSEEIRKLIADLTAARHLFRNENAQHNYSARCSILKHGLVGAFFGFAFMRMFALNPFGIEFVVSIGSGLLTGFLRYVRSASFRSDFRSYVREEYKRANPRVLSLLKTFSWCEIHAFYLVYDKLSRADHASKNPWRDELQFAMRVLEPQILICKKLENFDAAFVHLIQVMMSAE